MISTIKSSQRRLQFLEQLTHRTSGRPIVKYCFDDCFYKFPSYLRRAAINEAVGEYSSYRSNLAIWEADPCGRKPSFPKAGYVYPCMYHKAMFCLTYDGSGRVLRGRESEKVGGS